MSKVLIALLGLSFIATSVFAQASLFVDRLKCEVIGKTRGRSTGVDPT